MRISSTAVAAALVFACSGWAWAGNNIAPGVLTLTATYESIGIELPYTGDDNANSATAVRYRVSGGAWLNALPLWRVGSPDDGGSRAFYGSVCSATHNTSYEVEVTVTDVDGGGLGRMGTVTTRLDNISEASALMPTHFLSATGNDAADGLTAATAWRTIAKALAAAPSGAIVEVGPGYYSSNYTTGSSKRPTPITFKAKFPAVDNARNIINAGNHSVIEPPNVTLPSEGRWTSVALVGPTTGLTYNVYKCTVTTLMTATAGQLGCASTRAEMPKRVAPWKTDTVDLDTPESWAEKLYTNLTYNYGFWQDSRPGFANDVYLRLPGDLNPNNYYITMGASTSVALPLGAPNVRLTGLEIRGFQVVADFNHLATGAVIDHCYINFNRYGVYIRASASSPWAYGADHTIQHNLFRDSSLWSTTPGDAIPWHFIKSSIRNADGSSYGSRIGGQAEGAATGGAGSAKRVVVRDNTIEGLFNGISLNDSASLNRYTAQDWDVYANLIRQIGDDAIEPEHRIINFRCWNNRIEQALVVLSTGPVRYGPVYFFANQAWRTGKEGIVVNAQGQPASTVFKYSQTSTPQARLYIIGNTFWTDQPGADGGGPYASSGGNYEALYLRNNLIRATRCVFEAAVAPTYWDEDYNHFATIDTARGLRYAGTAYFSNVAAYRTATGGSLNTNRDGTFTTIGVSAIDNALAAPATGNLALTSTSVFRDHGVTVPNLAPAAAPDMGAYTPGPDPYAATDPSTALLYHFDETSGTTAADSSGNNRHATYRNLVTHPASRPGFGSAVQSSANLNARTHFTHVGQGTNSFLYCGPGSTGKDFTIEAWVRYGATPTNTQIIASVQPDTVANFDWVFGVLGTGSSAPGALFFGCPTDTLQGASASLTWTSNAWYHVAMVVHRDTTTPANSYIKLYRTPAGASAPVEVASVTGTAAVLTPHGAANDRKLEIANYYNASGGHYFQGRVDEVRFSTKVRASSEFLTLK